jgi:hypothetical protein
MRGAQLGFATFSLLITTVFCKRPEPQRRIVLAASAVPTSHLQSNSKQAVPHVARAATKPKEGGQLDSFSASTPQDCGGEGKGCSRHSSSLCLSPSRGLCAMVSIKVMRITRSPSRPTQQAEHREPYPVTGCAFLDRCTRDTFASLTRHASPPPKSAFTSLLVSAFSMCVCVCMCLSAWIFLLVKKSSLLVVTTTHRWSVAVASHGEKQKKKR